MAGDNIELVLPDGRILAAHAVSFGISAWKDSEGNLYIGTDPADPSLTLTITSDSDLTEVPAGAEVWLRDAKTNAESYQVRVGNCRSLAHTPRKGRMKPPALSVTLMRLRPP